MTTNVLNNKNTDFKVILNSLDTNTYTTVGGTRNNATYALDLKQKLPFDACLDKSYLMTFQLITTRDPVVNTNILTSNIYTVAITFSNGSTTQSVHQPLGSSNFITGLIPVLYDPSVPTNFLYATDQDNAPTFIPTLRNIQSVSVKIMTNGYVVLPDTINSMVVLHFKEIQYGN
jgi:hypothetical protein